MMAAKVEGATIDKAYSGISTRDARRAAGRRKKAARLEGAQRGIWGMGQQEGTKPLDKVLDDDRDKQYPLPG